MSRARARLARHLDDDRGDVPGWVLITLMTAGLAIGAQWGYCFEGLRQAPRDESLGAVVSAR